MLTSMLTSMPAEKRHFDLLPEDKKWAYNDLGYGDEHLWKAWYLNTDFVGVSICSETVGVVIMPEFRGQNLLGFMYPNERLVAEINVKNVRSIKAHKKIGFTVVHTKGSVTKLVREKASLK